MSTELKIFKSDTDQAIFLKKKTIEEMDLEIDETLIVTKIDEDFILTKKKDKTFDEEWDEFIHNGGSYDDKDMYDWGNLEVERYGK